ncbi:MAG: glutamine amidotransferase [Clostridia bacterium]|nr:glutamine amidotransferase [Clostridia bacterium]
MENKGLTIGHLFPDLLNMYGDKGNILALRNRLLWRGFSAEVIAFEKEEPIPFDKLDIVLLGGGDEKAQLLAGQRLQGQRKELLDYIEKGGVMLALCGGYEMLGRTVSQENETAMGLNILDICAEAGANRFIGNVVIQSAVTGEDTKIVGFENHSGRMNIGNYKPFGKVILGHGNNGEDGNCGVVYKNLIGTYLHGPLLPKNPHLTDYLLGQAFLQKYGEPVSLTPLADVAEKEAYDYAVNRFING